MKEQLLKIARLMFVLLVGPFFLPGPLWAVDENLIEPITEAEVLQVLNFYTEYEEALLQKDMALCKVVSDFYNKENPRLQFAAIRFTAALIMADGGGLDEVRAYLINHDTGIPLPTEAEVALAQKYRARYMEIMSRRPS